MSPRQAVPASTHFARKAISLTLLAALLPSVYAANYAYVPISGSLKVSVVNADTGVVTSVIDTASLGTPNTYTAVLRPGGTEAWVGAGGANIGIINTATNNAIDSTVASGTTQLPSITFKADGTAAYVISYSGKVIPVNATTKVVGTLVDTTGCTNPVSSVITSDDAKVYMACTGTRNIGVFDTTGGTFSLLTAVNSIGTNTDPDTSNFFYSLAYTSTGDALYAVNQTSTNGNDRLYKIAGLAAATAAAPGTPATPTTITLTNLTSTTTSVASVAVRKNGTKIYVGERTGGTRLHIIDAATTSTQTFIDVGANISGIGVSANDTALYVVLTNGSIKVVSTTTDAVTATIAAGAGATNSSVVWGDFLGNVTASANPVASTPGPVFVPIPTIPTGGATGTVDNGKTVNINDNGSSGTKLNLPTAGGTANINLPSGNVQVGNTAANTPVSVTQVALNGGNSIVLSAGGSSPITVTATISNQPLITTSDGAFTVVSGSSGSQASGTSTGVTSGFGNTIVVGSNAGSTKASLTVGGASNPASATGPTANALDNAVILQLPPATGTAAAGSTPIPTATLIVTGSGTLSFRSVTAPNGQVVTGIVLGSGSSLKISAATSGQTVLAVGNNSVGSCAAGSTFNVKSGSSSGSGGVDLEVLDGCLLLPAGTFASANRFAAIKDNKVLAGEAVFIDPTDKVTRVRLGTISDTSKLPGDRLTVDSTTAALFSDIKVPNLDGIPVRLGGTKTLKQVLLEAKGISNATQNEYGVWQVAASGSTPAQAWRAIGDVLVNTDIADGLTTLEDGRQQFSASGFQVTLVPTVAQPYRVVTMARASNPTPSFGAELIASLRSDGGYRFKKGGGLTSGGTEFVLRPASTSTANSGWGIVQESNVLFYADQTNKTRLTAIPADIAALKAAAKTVDAAATVQVDTETGDIKLVLSGKTYSLTADANLQTPPANEAGKAFWVDTQGRIVLRNGDGTAQAFVLK